MTEDATMTLSQHLDELRQRLLRSVYALLAGTLLAYFFSELIFAWLAQPLVRAWSDAGLGLPEIHFANPIEPFFTYLKVTLLAGVFISSPFIFYQLWQFVAPGLYKNEKRFMIPFTLGSAICFIGGACFGYFVVFPHGFRFFLGFARSNVGSMSEALGGSVKLSLNQTFRLSPTLMMGEYFGLVWRLLLAFGLVFELPLIITFLALVGMVDHRTLWKWNPYFVVVAFVLGAILTPPDIVTQLFMAGPLVALYNLSIALAWAFSRRRARQ